MAAKQRWYPSSHELTGENLLRVFRKTLDFIYEQNEQLGPSVMYARGHQDITIGEDTWTGISRCSVTFNREGRWLVVGYFTIKVDGAADVNKLFQGALMSNGRQEAKAKLKVQAQPEIMTISQAWDLNVAKNQMAVLQIHKETGATGTSVLEGANTVIVASWEGR